MKRLALFTLLCLFTGMVHAGTFELQDPAAQIMEEEKNADQEAQADADTGDMPDYVNDTGGSWNSGTDLSAEGIGNIMCSDHVASGKTAPGQHGINQYWLQGFIDGVAYQRFITLGDHRLEPVYEPEEMEVWIEEYCNENQPDSLFDAARAFLKSLTN